MIPSNSSLLIFSVIVDSAFLFNQTIQRLDPSFNYRALGYANFRNFVEAYPQLKITRPQGPGDITVELADPDAILRTEPYSTDIWLEIDNEWSRRAAQSGRTIPGPTAAAAVAGILGVTKLSASPYKTLQSLLETSDYLSTRWLRDGNTIIRR